MLTWRCWARHGNFWKAHVRSHSSLLRMLTQCGALWSAGFVQDSNLRRAFPVVGVSWIGPYTVRLCLISLGALFLRRHQWPAGQLCHTALGCSRIRYLGAYEFPCSFVKFWYLSECTDQQTCHSGCKILVLLLSDVNHRIGPHSLTPFVTIYAFDSTLTHLA